MRRLFLLVAMTCALVGGIAGTAAAGDQPDGTAATGPGSDSWGWD